MHVYVCMGCMVKCMSLCRENRINPNPCAQCEVAEVWSKNILTSSGLAKMVWNATTTTTTKSHTIFKLIRTINKAKFIIIYKSLTVPWEELPGWHTDVNGAAIVPTQVNGSV